MITFTKQDIRDLFAVKCRKIRGVGRKVRWSGRFWLVVPASWALHVLCYKWWQKNQMF